MYHCHGGLDSEQVCLPKFKRKEEPLVALRCPMLLAILAPHASLAPKPSPLGFQGCSKVPVVPPPRWVSCLGSGMLGFCRNTGKLCAAHAEHLHLGGVWAGFPPAPAWPSPPPVIPSEWGLFTLKLFAQQAVGPFFWETSSFSHLHSSQCLLLSEVATMLLATPRSGRENPVTTPPHPSGRKNRRNSTERHIQCCG